MSSDWVCFGPLQLSEALSAQLQGADVEIIDHVLLPTDPAMITADGLFVSFQKENENTCVFVPTKQKHE